MIVFKNNSNSESTNDFKDLIYIVRGVQVMLDSDLAGIYGYTVFTEQGIYMLMTVLRGELATRQTKTLIRTFKVDVLLTQPK